MRSEASSRFSRHFLVCRQAFDASEALSVSLVNFAIRAHGFSEQDSRHSFVRFSVCVFAFSKTTVSQHRGNVGGVTMQGISVEFPTVSVQRVGHGKSTKRRGGLGKVRYAGYFHILRDKKVKNTEACRPIVV